jgi:hypothetical protein
VPARDHQATPLGQRGPQRVEPLEFDHGTAYALRPVAYHRRQRHRLAPDVLEGGPRGRADPVRPSIGKRLGQLGLDDGPTPAEAVGETAQGGADGLSRGGGQASEKAEEAADGRVLEGVADSTQGAYPVRPPAASAAGAPAPSNCIR